MILIWRPAAEESAVSMRHALAETCEVDALRRLSGT